MVTVSCAEVNVTLALVAGPRTTPVDPKPCWGLHDTKYACASAQLATSVPPCEVSTVPPVPGAGGGAEGPAAGDDGGAVWRAIRDAGAMREAGGLLGQRAVDPCHALLLARAGDHALTKRAHREQATARRRARSDQPGCKTEENAMVHRPRVTRAMLSACKRGFMEYIYEKFI